MYRLFKDESDPAGISRAVDEMDSRFGRLTHPIWDRGRASECRDCGFYVTVQWRTLEDRRATVPGRGGVAIRVKVDTANSTFSVDQYSNWNRI
jgi:hypothetical protein